MATTSLYRPRVLEAGGVEFPANPFTGLDLRNDPKYTYPGQLLLAQNFVPYQRGALLKRKGSSYLNATPWTDITGVPFALRYYVNASTRKKLVAAQRGAGDQIGSVDDGTGAFTVLTGMPAVGASQRWRGVVFGEVPAAYFGNNNATDGILKTTDGVNIAALTGTQIPAKGFMGGPYFDRLLCWSGKRMFYSRTNLDTNWSNPTTGNAMWLFVNHTEDIEAVFLPGPDHTEVGFLGKLYICTPTSTWVHHQDFDQAAGTPVSSFTGIHETAGVASFNTLAWAPGGAIGLGTRDVWFFPIAGLPMPVSGQVETIIRAIPAQYRKKCSAVYWDGFYILSYVRPGQTTPDRELWADVRGLSSDSREPDRGVQWYGPMIRANTRFGCFLVQTQQPDENELFGLSATEGRCLALEQPTYLDASQIIASKLTTADLTGGQRGSKTFEGYIIGTYVEDNDNVTVGYEVDEGKTSASQNVSLTAVGSRWDTDKFDEAVWGAGTFHDLTEGHWDARPSGHKIRLTVEHNGAKNFGIKELSAVAHVLGRIT